MKFCLAFALPCELSTLLSCCSCNFPLYAQNCSIPTMDVGPTVCERRTINQRTSKLQACCKHGMDCPKLVSWPAMSSLKLAACCRCYSYGPVVVCFCLTKLQGFSWSKVLAVPGCTGAKLSRYCFCSDRDLLTCCSDFCQGQEVMDHDFANCSLLLSLLWYPDKTWKKTIAKISVFKQVSKVNNMHCQ